MFADMNEGRRQQGLYDSLMGTRVREDLESVIVSISDSPNII